MKIMLIGRRYARILILAAVVFTFRGVAPTEATAATWYVSNRASRGDGRSWATAWNELDRIDLIQPPVPTHSDHPLTPGS